MQKDIAWLRRQTKMVTYEESQARVTRSSNFLKTNWREIEEAIKHESQAEDCMIPIKERTY